MGILWFCAYRERPLGQPGALWVWVCAQARRPGTVEMGWVERSA